MNDEHTQLVPRKYLWNTLALMALLGLTLAAYELPVGPIRLVSALVIAGAKATLVALFFMHLAPASPSTRLFAAAGLIWLALLIGLTLCDVLMRT